MAERDNMYTDSLEEAEFKSDDQFSAVPAPVKKKAESPEDDKSKPKEKSNIKGVKTKAGMMTNAFDAMKNLSKAELAERHKQIMAAIDGMNEQDDDLDDDEEENGNGKKKKSFNFDKKKKKNGNGNDDDEENGNGNGNNFKKRFESFKLTPRKVKAADLEFDAEVNAVFSDDGLSEEFKDKATELFETILVAKINEGLAEYAAEASEELQEMYKAHADELETSLDEYLEYVVEEWSRENELAIESGIRADITESFISGLKKLFEDHYIDVPDSKVDVVDELGREIEALEEKVSTLMKSNMNLKEEVESHSKQDVLDEFESNMVGTDFEKFRGLAENVEFKDVDDYRGKLNMLKENFSTDGQYIDGGLYLNEEIDPVDGEEDETSISPQMKRYVRSIGNSIRK